MMRYLLVLVLAIAADAGFHRAHVPRPRLDGRIVGGSPVSIKEYNYQISLQYFGGHYCGGSIISETVVLTAAHCTEGSSPSYFEILYGTDDLYSGGGIVSVSQIFVHPDYNSRTIDFDVSVLHLGGSITFSDSAQPTILTTTPQSAGNLRSATVSGWGALSSGGGSPSVLYAVDVEEFTNADCNNAYGSITDRMICFGAPGKDSCQGDSGGPLVDVSNREQVGIVSWGYGCADPNYPGVYSNVYNLKSWIDGQSRK
ncbi:hypothetical protein FQA39_LY17424 [Lamprigera yunnana]|nr:hypothetical protein FQA39_LY17424 [Lamprigera yunnana]